MTAIIGFIRGSIVRIVLAAGVFTALLVCGFYYYISSGLPEKPVASMTSKNKGLPVATVKGAPTGTETCFIVEGTEQMYSLPGCLETREKVLMGVRYTASRLNSRSGLASYRLTVSRDGKTMHGELVNMRPGLNRILFFVPDSDSPGDYEKHFNVADAYLRGVDEQTNKEVSAL